MQEYCAQMGCTVQCSLSNIHGLSITRIKILNLMSKSIVHKWVIWYNVVYATSILYQLHELTSTNFNVYAVMEHEKGSVLQPQRIQTKLLTMQ